MILLVLVPTTALRTGCEIAYHRKSCSISQRVLQQVSIAAIPCQTVVSGGGDDAHLRHGTKITNYARIGINHFLLCICFQVASSFLIL